MLSLVLTVHPTQTLTCPRDVAPNHYSTQVALVAHYLNLVLRKQRHKTSTEDYATQLPRCTPPLLAPAWKFPEPTAETGQRKRSKQKYSRPQDTLHKVVHAPK